MRPDLRKYSITSFQSQVFSDSSMAVAKRDGMTGSEEYGRSRVKTPSDLIHDETLVTLIQEVRELRQRCDSLEDVNAELRHDLDHMWQVQGIAVTHDGAKSQFTESYKEPNLTGYASSEASAFSETAAFGKDSMTDTRGFEEFQNLINDKVDTMTSILESFKRELEDSKAELKAESVARYKLGQDLERTKHDATKTKGRLGAMEVQAKEIRTEVDELSDSAANMQKGHAPIGHHSQHNADSSDDTQQQLEAALAEIEDLTFEVKHQGDVINGLQGRLDAGAVSTTPGSTELTAADYASRISTVNASSRPEFTFIQRTLHTIMHKANMQQRIDDMCSKDQLHVAFTQLSRCIDTNSSGDEILTAGPFTGTYDELWSLRDRAIRRLTTIDRYGLALQEAKRAEVYL